jgi:2,3-bisphosphoglycerate-dependent phosphoglycerate mutase
VLTEAGRAQARRLGELVAAEPIELCVTSAFARAKETADIALEGRDVPRLVVPELNDIRFGDFEALSLDEYRTWAHSAGPTDVPPGEGESRAACVARYALGFRTLLARPERLVLVVVHGLPIRYVLNALEGRAPQPVLDQVPYTAPFRVSAEELDTAVGMLEAWAAAPAWS